jgi:putative flippase GtrA
MAFLGKDTLRFAIVGSVGFLVDSSILTLLVRVGGWNPFSARLVSISIAVLFMWLAHRHWTFPTGRLRSPLPQTVIYGVVQFIGLSINYAVFSALILAGAFWREFPVLAVAGGSLTAMTFNYLLSKTIAFAALAPRQA